ncbi:MAG: DUF1080 domain-containing protein [Bacteroidales bacterium]|nr:DUF1080 domain-containing protein [Bacteroidales bacterium]
MKIAKLVFSLVIITSILFACAPKEKKQTDVTKGKVEKKIELDLCTMLTKKEIEEGWVLLFDGESPEHFRGYNRETFPEKGWEVVNGTLHVMATGKGEAGGGGDIITRKMYKNFELSLEWKVSDGGNSGIFYLAQEKPGQPIWKSAPEMQILDNAKHPDAKLGVDGNRAAGALYDLIPGNKEVVKPAGEWNHVKVLVYKGTVVHWVNGENVLEYHLWTDDWNNMVLNSKFKDYEDFLNTAEEGYIGLQDHGDDVWFRNIKIKEM